MKVTFEMNGRRKVFSKVKNVFIEEETQSKVSGKSSATVVPKEGIWFKVVTKEIDRELFSQKRDDTMQEITRRVILKAFDEIRMDQKLNEPFETLVPKKYWKDEKTMQYLREKVAAEEGGTIATWIELALEWAQRISNGETWEIICNEDDTMSYFRLVIWEYCSPVIVGGAVENDFYFPPATIHPTTFGMDPIVYGTVPLIVRRRDT